MTRLHDPERQEMQKAVDRRRARRAMWETTGERPLWRNLSMIGALGWLIVLPTLAGVFLGRWLDRLFATGITFSAALTLVGVCLGFWLAWKRMHAE